jgi:hypothetical protein
MGVGKTSVQDLGSPTAVGFFCGDDIIQRWLTRVSVEAGVTGIPLTELRNALPDYLIALRDELMREGDLLTLDQSGSAAWRRLTREVGYRQSPPATAGAISGSRCPNRRAESIADHPHRLGPRASLHREGRDLRELGPAMPSNCRADAGGARGAHAQTIETEPYQQTRGQWIASSLPADRDRLFASVGSLRDMSEGAQQRGLEDCVVAE